MATNDNDLAWILIPEDKICESIKMQQNNSKLNILAIGTTRTRMLLITNDYYVYDLPVDSMDTVNNKLNLLEMPKPITEKYPHLYQDKRFQYMKSSNLIYTSFIMTDANSEWICITTWTKQTMKRGVNYDMKNAITYYGWKILEVKEMIIISTTEQCKLYGIKINGNLKIADVKCEERDSKIIRHVEYLGTDELINSLCYHKTDTQMITIEYDECGSKNPVQWPILNGFVAGRKFYLLGKHFIYIFSEDAYYKKGQPYPVTKLDYNSFINCISTIQPKSSKIISYPLLNKILNWITITIIILSLILMQIWFSIIGTFCRRRHRGRSATTTTTTTVTDKPSSSSSSSSVLQQQPQEKTECSKILPMSSAYCSSYPMTDVKSIRSTSQQQQVPFSCIQNTTKLNTSVDGGGGGGVGGNSSCNGGALESGISSTDISSSSLSKICESIRKRDGNKLNIFAIGTTQTRLLLITNDLYVYDLPIKTMDTNIDVLNFYIKSDTMAEKYPILYRNETFQKLMKQNQIYNSFIMTDANSEWICMTTKQTESIVNGINYDLKHSHVYDGWTIIKGNVEIADMLCEEVNYVNRQHDDMLRVSPFLKLCYDKTDREKIISEKFQCQSGNPVQWPILKGFLVGGKFYLFGEHFIYIITENVFVHRNHPYPVTKIDYNSFFNCPGTIQPIPSKIMSYSCNRRRSTTTNVTDRPPSSSLSKQQDKSKCSSSSLKEQSKNPSTKILSTPSFSFSSSSKADIKSLEPKSQQQQQQQSSKPQNVTKLERKISTTMISRCSSGSSIGGGGFSSSTSEIGSRISSNNLSSSSVGNCSTNDSRLKDGKNSIAPSSTSSLHDKTKSKKYDDDNKMTTTAQPKDETCETLHNHNGAKLNILAVGRTPTRMLLITMDFYVYDVPIDSIDTAINKLYLRTKPIPMSEKYPVLFNDQRFQQIKDVIFNSFIMTDADSEWICITTKSSETRYSGINYDIKDPNVYYGWKFFDYWREVLISTIETCIYYALRHNQGNLEITRYQCRGGDRIRTRPRIIRLMSFRPICFDSTGQKITVERHRCRSANPVRWPVLKGFTDGGKFYLFGQYYIYIFDENVFREQGSSYPVTKRSYDSFFNCAGYIPAGQVSRSRAVSCTTAVSGRSMPATVRTGFNHRASSNNPSNRFKSLTPRIQSSRNR
ncbi:hypothetical protein DERF_009663 [Dermatophagoides farinae]|uniref:Uncharacterized protein n=1 Tax=Dermatophagoides farinae TaxID=6954 RepID=A0A922L5Z4_DERFA|nr:hypothetical protein DERF_009663 [Dermatophagoides farinae]